MMVASEGCFSSWPISNCSSLNLPKGHERSYVVEMVVNEDLRPDLFSEVVFSEEVRGMQQTVSHEVQGASAP